MSIIDLVVISYCIDNPRGKNVIANAVAWWPQGLSRLDHRHACPRYRRHCQLVCLCIMICSINLVSGCGTTAIHHGAHAKAEPNPETGRELAAIARSLLGVPYLWGGTSRKGLDCSGLVQYAHRKVGISVPRNSEDQLMRASPVHPSKLRPGDLVFFNMSWRYKPSHVGIYAGDGRFIHAPSSGKSVSYASLQNPYWKKRLLAAGRFY